MNDQMSLEELQTLKDLVMKLDDKNEVFKLSNDIIKIKEKTLKKELNNEKGDNEK